MDSLTTRFQKEVFAPYLDLLKAEYRFHPAFDHVRKMWEEKLTTEELLKGPYLEKSQIYLEGDPLNDLPLHEKTKATIRRKIGGRSLWKHQTEALKLILSEKNAVIATGTSSGKTLCYQIPILDNLIRNPSPGLCAIIVYPLNALVNDQLSEWESMLADHPQITFARFTGQTPNSQIDYESTLRKTFSKKLSDKGLLQHELQRKVKQNLDEYLRTQIPNRLNHREDIRSNPPQVLITNFSMLEYLLERPVDAPIFENARLKFLVLDEAHAYRGVQATEIAFLIQRIKERLRTEKLICIATSATLGEQDDTNSQIKVRKFAANLFGEEFLEPNPIYGNAAEPPFEKPTFEPTPNQYIKAAEILRENPESDIWQCFGITISDNDLASLLLHDINLYRLRKDILTKPTKLKEAAESIWPENPQAEEGLGALLEIVAIAKNDQSHEDLLPTRLHYFVRAQDGLHVCLHKKCSGRRDGKPAFFVSRKNEPEIPEGDCPKCYKDGRTSKLVEIVTCRKCGYLYGALQDLGPRREQNPGNNEEQKPYFDSFSTELGWWADSFWSYFSVTDDLPYPTQQGDEEDEENQLDLFKKPDELEWCVVCGKKNDPGAGDNCTCDNPHLRTIKMFHRQCPSTDYNNLSRPEKTLLNKCPNCGAINCSGIEPVHRFQESDDAIGLAMAIPLAHFQVNARRSSTRPIRKLLCFTDHRQRAAAFPSLLEEETFDHDMGRMILRILENENHPFDLVSLGKYLAEIADDRSEKFDPDFFLPVSRLPDGRLEARDKENLWLAETFAYFGIPDAARESVEDLGLVAVEYCLKDSEKSDFRKLLNASNLVHGEAESLLQILLGFMRQRKAFTLPTGIQNDSPAFGRVIVDIAYELRHKSNNTNGWLPLGNNKDNFITDYIRRVLSLSRIETNNIAEKIWYFLTNEALLIGKNGRWKLDHEKLFVTNALYRYVCNRCGIITAYSVKKICPKKGCTGKLELHPFDPAQENIIARWVSGKSELQFSSLRSEEHTAQINKELAKEIEDDFRAEGVNLLSSTTTFEMGINIGDLQKILMRNAPPSSANYVQRVGRAGRGTEKNSVCVTLCRRTKYDADAWNEPKRLMSGKVRTPTVFLENRIISQRHFNAHVFAQFLRIKIADERILSQQVKQKIRMEAFVFPDARTNIPEGWCQIRPCDLFLDFREWLIQMHYTDIFKTEALQSLLEALSGFDKGKEAAIKIYSNILYDISEELKTLMGERENLHKKGIPTNDIEQAIKNLLSSDIISVLAKRGFLPRYAFPLDVVTLETERTRWQHDSDVELSRDRGIAIAEFAPGSQVIAHKKVFTCAGLYIISNNDKPDRKWYSECPSCKQIRTSQTQEPLIVHCAVCQRSITTQYIRPFVEPVAFSVTIDETHGSARHRRSTLLRQRQTITHFIDHVEESNFQDFELFRLALKESGKLFRYNSGPKSKGFMLCPVCGRSEPLLNYKAGKKHQRLRPYAGIKKCDNDQPWTKPLAYGHEFQSFCLVARPKKAPQSIESLAFALQRGLCNVLDLETSDIGVSWRWLANDRIDSEIILYDQTPGGAGFVKEGFENWGKVLKEAKKVCESCKCENACYDCLKSYGNQSFHEKLNRHSIIDYFS